MSEILIQSKITTPRLTDKIVHRERLTKLIDENKNKNLMIICAPAGFGKTTLVLDYLSLHKNKHAWFSIPQKGIENAPTFFEYLISAVRNLNEEFGPATLEVMKQFASSPKMAKELVYACTASFVNEFQKYFTDDVVLVIEDLHYVESEKSQKWLKEFFKELLDNIPPNLHLILSTRVMPDVTLTNLKAKRNAFIIGENDLSFSEQETAALIDEVYKYKYDKNDIKLLDENTKGWITGLHLLLQAYGEDFAKVKYKGDLDKETIFDFFAKEIFDNLSPEMQEFMMVTSLMESFDEKLANSVLRIDNSRTLLTELFFRNLFIHEIHTIGKGNTLSYGYHALFRDFLNRRLRTSRIEYEIKKLMEEIGDSYLNLGDEISAIDYFLEGGNFDKAVKLISTNYSFTYNSGKYDKLWEWFNSIPEKIIYESPFLSFRIGCLYLYTNTDYESSLYYIDNACKLFKDSENEDYLVLCAYVRVHILEYSGKIKQAAAELESLLESCHNPDNVIVIYSRLSSTYSEWGKYKEAQTVLVNALKYCDDNNLDQKTRDELNEAFFLLYYYTGDYNKALIYLNKKLKNDTILYNIIMTNCNIASTYNDMGDYANSIKYYDIAFKLMKNSYSRELLVHLTGQKALLLQSLGDFDESSKMLQSMYLHVEKNNALIYLWTYNDYLSMNYYLSGDQINCLKYLNLNRSIQESLGDEHFKKMFQFREVQYLMKYEPNISMEKKILDFYYYEESAGSPYKTSVLFTLSKFYLTMHRPESVLKHLGIFLKKSSIGANYLIDSRDLIDFALSRPELASYKNKVHNAFVEFFDRLNIEGTTDEYKRKMRIEIDKLYDIKMTSFGNLEFISRGVPVPESKWKKKKGKSILAYMMLNPKAKYNKDKIIDMFFPDARPDTVEDSFKQAVFSIRSTFKNPYLNFLILESKMLYLNPDCYFKSDAEEFNQLCIIARSAEKKSEEKIQACKDAIELYKGEFLEGNYEPWCEDLRGDFHNKFISVSELLLDMLNQEKRYEEIIQYSERLLKHDKLNEKAYLGLIDAYMKSEKKKSAKQSYSNMLKQYQEEIGEEPDEITLSKIESLLGN